MREIHWLLDFDGVINIDRSPWKEAPFNSIAYSGGRQYKIRWCPSLIGKIRLVHRQGVRIFWASTWCGDTDQLERITKLPPLLSARPTEMSYRLKCEAAEAVVDSGHRLIWTDDEAVPTSGAFYRKLVKAGSLLIKPHPRRGLTPEHLDSIMSFVSKHYPAKGIL